MEMIAVGVIVVFFLAFFVLLASVAFQSETEEEYRERRLERMLAQKTYRDFSAPNSWERKAKLIERSNKHIKLKHYLPQGVTPGHYASWKREMEDIETALTRQENEDYSWQRAKYDEWRQHVREGHQRWCKDRDQMLAQGIRLKREE